MDALPPETCNAFREPVAFQQSASSTYFVFDRRSHAVFSVPPDGRGAVKVVDIGGEGGRLLEPSAFDLAPDGSFAVADAPRGQARLQVFEASGRWRAGFFLPGRAEPRLSIEGATIGGVSGLAYLSDRLAVNLPETGSLITEYALTGAPLRSVGALRATGHEGDASVHLAMNTGLPLAHPDGGYVFVFVAGAPAFRRYDANGSLVYERVMQGRELDPVIAQQPKLWPRRTVDGREFPVILPTVRSAAIDGAGRLWVSFLGPFTYVFDAGGEKVRTVQFRATGIIRPASLFFSKNQRLLVTPGCFVFPIEGGS